MLHFVGPTSTNIGRDEQSETIQISPSEMVDFSFQNSKIVKCYNL